MEFITKPLGWGAALSWPPIYNLLGLYRRTLEAHPLTVQDRKTIAEAVAIWQGRILATGQKSEIASLIGPSTRVIDLQGRLATPGLNDSHLHLVSLGLMMDWVDAKPSAAPTLDALLAAKEIDIDEVVAEFKVARKKPKITAA